MKLLAPLATRPVERLDPLGLDPLDAFATFTVGGNTYTIPIQTTWPGQKTEPIAERFEALVAGALKSNSVIFTLERKRLELFSQARFQWQRFNSGRPGDLFGDQSLAVLEHPWPSGTTGDLLASMLIDADFAGNCFVTIIGGQVIALRPDWTEIVLGDRAYNDDLGDRGIVGKEKLGYAYYNGGKSSGVQPVFFSADEVTHFAPMPDPTAWYRGMSWLTPVIREIQADGGMTNHKLAFMENAATPNLAVSLKEITDPQQFADFVDKMDDSHKGWQNAYKTLYLGAGADVTVIGRDMKELDFKVTQGAGETRLAAAAGIHPVVAALSEGLQGSSLNAGNFAMARRITAETTLEHLWQNVAGSLETIVPPADPATRLWVDRRDIPFLREDEKDAADIALVRAQTIEQLLRGGYRPDSVIAAVMNDDFNLLMGQHSGLFSIQLQEPGAGNPKLPGPTVDKGNANNPTPVGAVEKPVKVAAPSNGAHP